MFGNENGPDHDDHGIGLGQVLFGLWLWRELDSGRLEPGQVFKAVALLGLVLGGGFLVLLIAVGASVERPYVDTDPWTPLPAVTSRPAVVAPAPAWTPRPAVTPQPTETPKRASLPGLGTKVKVGGGWWVRVDRVERWQSPWGQRPGWQVVTVRVTVGMPADDDGCVFGSMLFVTAPSGRDYAGFEGGGRQPSLLDCSDDQRRTQAKGWVTFEIRDRDAKGLVLRTCVPEMFGCDDGPRIRLRK